MEKCKDCLHYKACKIWVEDTKKEFNFTPLLIPCAAFKNKADVVEVVRCKDCKKRYTKNCSLCYNTVNKGHFLWSMINDNFFCAYGERKCADDGK